MNGTKYIVDIVCLFLLFAQTTSLKPIRHIKTSDLTSPVFQVLKIDILFI